MSIGQRIKELRTQQNISQGQIAQSLAVSRQAVSKWENDTAAPDALRMIQLADLLNTDLEYLATGRVTPKEPAPIIVHLWKKDVPEAPPPSPPPKPKTIVKRVTRTRIRYVRNPLEFAAIGIVGFLIGLLMGVLVL